MLKVSTPDGKLTRLVEASQRQEYIDKGWIIEDTSEVEMMLDADGNTLWRYKEDTEWNTISGGSGGGDTYKVKVDGTDTAEYLEDKLVEGSNITITKTDGKLTINTTGSGAGVTVYSGLAAIKAVDTTSLTSGTLAQVVTLGQFVFNSTSNATGDDISVIVPTTGGGRWLLQSSSDSATYKKTTTTTKTTNVNHLQVKENGIIKESKLYPLIDEAQKINKICVTIGDSNMAGYGLADTSMSYMSQFLTYLQTNHNYNCVNVATGGDSVKKMADRFYTDVAKYKPDLVIVSTSLQNGGLRNLTIESEMQKSLNNEKQQIAKIVNMCKSIGADYMIMGCYPYNTTNFTSNPKALELNAYFAMIYGEKYINYYSCLCDETGAIVANYRQADLVHFNQAGHNEIYQMLVKKDLDKKNTDFPAFFTADRSKGITIPNDTTNNLKLILTSVLYNGVENFEAHKDFATGIEFIPNLTVDTKRLFWVKGSLSNSQSINLHTDASNNLILKYSASAGAVSTILTTTNVPKNKINRVTLSYSSANKKVTLYLDGVQIGVSSAIPEDFVYDNKLYLFSGFPATENPVLYTIRNFYFYRTALSIEEVKIIHSGKFLTSNLYFFHPLDKHQATYFNYAQFSAYITNGYATTDGGITDNEYTDVEKEKVTAVNAVGTAVASAAIIAVPANKTIFHVTGTTAISTINVPYAGFTGKISIISDGVFTFDTAGNIAETYTATVNRCIDLVYDGTKWYRV